MDDAKQNPSASDSDAQAKSYQLQAEEYLAGWKRAQADYQNLKKEAEREKGEYVKYANERLLENLLPVQDQFAMALKHTPDTEALPEEQKKIWVNWLTGMKAVQSLWEQTMKSIGLERILTEGGFDPTLHEAVGEESIEGKKSSTIIRVMQDGWKLHGKVLRPARVIIAK